MARSKKKNEGSGWVVTRECATCGRVESECSCGSSDGARGDPAIVRLRMEKRRGKPVTVVAMSGVDESTGREWSKELKGKCASGGTFKHPELELQGEHRDLVRQFFSSKGLVVKG